MAGGYPWRRVTLAAVALARWLDRLTASRVRPRTAGRPPSSNGASSFHLFWLLPGELVEVGATLEVVEPPRVDRLFFWALQVSFSEGGRRSGGAHLGLQHHPEHPGGGAVNWGGYRSGGGELDGSTSSLPSTLGNANTRDFPWRPGVRYRLRVHAAPGGGWRGAVRELPDGDEVVVRDLWADGDALVAPMVWSEVFADCDHPTTAVRWSDLSGLDRRGDEVRPSGLQVNYQDHAAGGCANTSSQADEHGVVQRTNTPRVVPQGALLPPV